MRQIATSNQALNNLPLEHAFRTFNEVSERLTESYQLLEQQVVNLSAELSKANTEKLKHLSEKEQITDQLGSLLESLPGAVIVVNADGDIVKVNACARDWLTTELIGKSWHSVEQAYLLDSEQLTSEFMLSDNRVIALSKTKLKTQQGFVILLSDITQQRELHQQLEHKKKLAAMGEFSAELAHQIRTPLSSALLYASQINSDLTDPERNKKYSTKLLERLRHINHQVSDMIGYAHKGHFKKSLYNLHNVSLQLANSYQDNTHVLSVEMKNVMQDTSVDISKDALFGAIDNLINNALDAAGGESQIHCQISVVDAKLLVISVTDDGVGLQPSEVERVFEPFYTSKSNGTGLGLAVVSEVVKAHNGSISCTSTPDKGTTFTMLLPVVVEQSVQDWEKIV